MQKEKLIEALSIPFSDRLWQVAAALRRGIEIEKLYKLTGIDPWFLDNLKRIIEFENIDIARKFYESEKYQAAKAVRELASNTHLVLVEGS